MKKFWLVGLALATALATAPAAMADSFYVVITGVECCSNSGTSGLGHVSGSAVLTGNSLGGGSFNITSATYTSITVDGVTYSDPSIIINGTPGILNASNNGFWYDDVLNTSSPYVAGGILFQLPGSPYSYLDIYINGPGAVLSESNAAGTVYNPSYPISGYDVSLAVSATPEPSSWLLLGTGLLFLAGFLFRKTKPSMIQAV